MKAQPVWAAPLVDSCEDDEDGGSGKGGSWNKSWEKKDMCRDVRVHMSGRASGGIDLDIFSAMAEMDFPGASSSYDRQKQNGEEKGEGEGEGEGDDGGEEKKEEKEEVRGNDDGDDGYGDGDGDDCMSELSDPDERAVLVGVHASIARRAMRDPDLADLSWPDEEEPRPMPSPHPQYGAGCAEVLHAWRLSSPSHLLFRRLSTTVSEKSPSPSPTLSPCLA
jgi:hypothetical protein